MGLPDVKISITNSLSPSSSGNEEQEKPVFDCVTGLLLSGYEVPGQLELGKVYLLHSIDGLGELGVTEENNPLVYKDVHAFYEQAQGEADLYLLVEDVNFSMYHLSVNYENNELCKLIDAGEGRIRLVGINFYPKHDDYTSESGFDTYFTRGATGINTTAEIYAGQFNPFRVFIPAYGWDKNLENLYKPREQNLNRVSFVMASDAIYYDFPSVPQYTSPAIGQVLGRAVTTPLHQSIADPELGPIATTGYLSDGSTPEESAEYYSMLDEAGYIIYKKIDSSAGYYLNSDAMANGYMYNECYNLNEARLVDKAMTVAYTSYCEDIRPNIDDEKDYITEEQCVEFGNILTNAINGSMEGHLQIDNVFINPTHNIYTSSYVEVVCAASLFNHLVHMGFTYKFPYTADREEPQEPNPDCITGLLLTGYEIPGKLELGKVYHLQTIYDFNELGVTEDNNPLVYKDVNAFYTQAGKWAELYLLVQHVDNSMYELCKDGENSFFRKLIDGGQGRIRLVGINFYPIYNGYIPMNNPQGIDNILIDAAESVNAIAESYAEQLNPFRVFLPAYGWDKYQQSLYKPCEQLLKRVGFVIASDKVYYNFPFIPEYASPAIGQVLGRAAAIPVHQSIADPDLGQITATAYLSDGNTPEESAEYLPALNVAGYIIYTPIDSKKGYYFNSDSLSGYEYQMLTDGRLIDKALGILYNTYLEKIRPELSDDEDYISDDQWKVFNEILRNDILDSGIGEYLYLFSTSIDSSQNIYKDGYVEIELEFYMLQYASSLFQTYRFPFIAEREEPQKPKPDDIAGLLLAGYEIPGKLELNKVYHLRTIDDFNKLGVTQENNPLVYKDVHAFYKQAGHEAELYLQIEDVEFSIYDLAVNNTGNALCKLIDAGEGNIRLVGINIYPKHEDYVPDSGFDTSFTRGVIGINKTAEQYAEQFNFFRVMVPAYGWNGKVEKLYNPRERELKRLCFIMASDVIFDDFPYNTQYASPAIGQILGKTVATPLNYSIAGPELGPLATTGYLSDGSTPEESAEYSFMLEQAGFIIYKPMFDQTGYYLSYDSLATNDFNCYSIGAARLIDKAIRTAYQTYIENIRPAIPDDNHYISEEQWKEFEELLKEDIQDSCEGYLDLISATIDLAQNIHTLGYIEIGFWMHTHFYAGPVYQTYRFPFLAESEEITGFDSVAGLLLSGYEIPGKLELGKVYRLKTIDDFNKLGVTQENNPLVYKDVHAFYEQAGNNGELYLLVEDVYTDMYSLAENTEKGPLCRLIDFGKGRIRLMGVNIYPIYDHYSPGDFYEGLDHTLIGAAQSIQDIAESYANQSNPFRVLIPAYGWNKETRQFYMPCEQNLNHLSFVMASDSIFYNLPSVPEYASPAIGQVLGRAVSTPLCQSIADPELGPIATTGYLSDGSTPEESGEYLDLLHGSGYIIYHTIDSKDGYYLNDDPMATAIGNDYYQLHIGRVFDMAMVIAYSAFKNEISSKIVIDENGSISDPQCLEFENLIRDTIFEAMGSEIEDCSILIYPHQNVIDYMEIMCYILIKGTTNGFDAYYRFKIK